MPGGAGDGTPASACRASTIFPVARSANPAGGTSTCLAVTGSGLAALGRVGGSAGLAAGGGGSTVLAEAGGCVALTMGGDSAAIGEGGGCTGCAAGGSFTAADGGSVAVVPGVSSILGAGVPMTPARGGAAVSATGGFAASACAPKPFGAEVCGAAGGVGTSSLRGMPRSLSGTSAPGLSIRPGSSCPRVPNSPGAFGMTVRSSSAWRSRSAAGAVSGCRGGISWAFAVDDCDAGGATVPAPPPCPAPAATLVDAGSDAAGDMALCGGAMSVARLAPALAISSSGAGAGATGAAWPGALKSARSSSGPLRDSLRRPPLLPPRFASFPMLQMLLLSLRGAYARPTAASRARSLLSKMSRYDFSTSLRCGTTRLP